MATIFDSHFAKPNNRSASPKPTQHEVEAFGQALKRPEFRAMLCDYVQELSDPANRETYKKEMTQLEGERGNHVTFLIPTPGHVIKTRVVSSNFVGTEDSENQLPGNVGKVFVNICGDENIEDASQMVDKRDVQGRIPWAIPFSSSKPRRDVDKAGEKCVVYDVIFHPNVVKKAAGNFQFREMVNLTALDGLEKFFDIKLDRKRLRFPKLKFKGSSHASVVRRPMTEDEKKAYHQKYPDNLSEAESKKYEAGSKKYEAESKKYENLEDEESIPKKASEKSEKTEDHKNPSVETPQTNTLQPKYVIKYRYEQRDLPTHEGGPDPCRPTSMVVEISLPEMSSAKGIDLDVLEHLLTLESSLPVAYKLVLKLPYPVHDDQGSAKFDKSLHTLAVTLPVKVSKESVSRLVSVDSGIGLEFDEQCDQDLTQRDTLRESQEEQDLDSGVVMTKDDGLEDVDLDDHETILEPSIPPYVCNIYEGLMVVTMALRNVVAGSLKKTVLKDSKGYYLTFHTMGEGFVPIHYGFCLSFDFEAGSEAVEAGDCHIEDLDVEVWDNNMIVQLSMPKLGCQSYSVGCHPEDLGGPLHLPRFEAVKESARYLLGKKNGHNVMKLKPSGDGLDSDDSNADEDEEDLENAKERHSSGESNDSAVSFSVPTSPTKLNPGGDENEDPMGGDSMGSNRFLVIPSDFCQSMKDNCNLRGILRRQKTSQFERKPRFESTQSESAATSGSLLRMMSSPACSNGSSGTIVEEDENEEMMSGDSMAGSKKSVRFNEVVLRQVYRSNSSIVGQKHKNQKKAEQKRRKAGRRASEGDKPDSDSKTSFSAEKYEDYHDQDHTNDSGMASSMDESSGSVELTGKGNNKKKTMVEKNSSKPNGESKMKNKRSKVASKFMDVSHGHSDLIFNLDFY